MTAAKEASMRIPLVMLAACLSAVSFAAPAPTSSAPATRSLSPPSAAGPCRFDGLRRHAAPATAEARRLGELPPGNLELAVVREEGGCITPVIVRYGIGGARGR
jgi:hypothetical protein